MKPSVKPTAHLRVEWLPKMPWNECPRCRGIGAHLPWNAHINLAKSVMAALGTINSTLIVDAFWQGAGVVKGNDASDRIVYNTSTGALYYDADGSGSGAAVQLVQIGTTASHPASLTAADFFVF